MIADSRRLETSVGVATFSHAAFFGLYLFLRAVSPSEETVKLTKVDFIDLTPKPPAAVAVPSSGIQQRAPKSFKDFLHMALPSFKTPKPATSQLKDAQEPTLQPMQNMPTPETQKLLLRENPSLQKNAASHFRFMKSQPVDSAHLSDLSVQRPTPSEMPAEMPTEKAISLEAVGRVKATQKEINFNASAHFKSSAQMKDLPDQASPAPSDGSLRDARPSAIDLSAHAAAVSPGAALPSSDSLPIGYEKGISLKEGPARIGTSALPKTTAPAPLAKNNHLKSIKHKGMEISGPLADRKILEAYSPAYPDWAKSRGIEAEAVIRFYVSADGDVLDRMIIERTSGYHRLDELCMETLKKMVFAPLPGGQGETQWGFITFRFKLQ